MRSNSETVITQSDLVVSSRYYYNTITMDSQWHVSTIVSMSGQTPFS